MLDAKEEQSFNELRALGQELHIPILEAFWTLEVRDKEGRLIQRYKQRSHSWVRNAYNHLFSNMCSKNATSDTWGGGHLNFKDTGGTVRGTTDRGAAIASDNYESDSYGVKAPITEDTWGLLVGSGTNAESFEDYTLQTKIAHGTGSGQLSYGAGQAHSVSYTAGTKVFEDELVRYFNNNSGAAIDVNEVGMIFRVGVAFYTTARILLARDKLASTVTVPNTGQLKVTYTIELTYPA